MMNTKPSNWVQETIVGYMAQLPGESSWKYLVLRSGETLLWSSEDLQLCFYIFELPSSWRRWKVFEKPIPRLLLGLNSEEPIYLAAKVVPMGWVPATGVVLHIHRRLLREVIFDNAALDPSAELRRDRPLLA